VSPASPARSAASDGTPTTGGSAGTAAAAGATGGDAANAAQSFQFLKPDQLDDLARAFLHLAREVWVLRDRQRIFEAALAERGIDVAEAIDRYQPSADLQRQLDAERAAFVRTLLGALAPSAKL